MDVLRDTDLFVSLLLVLNVTQVSSHDMTAIWLYIISLQLSMDRCPHLKDHHYNYSSLLAISVETKVPMTLKTELSIGQRHIEKPL